MQFQRLRRAFQIVGMASVVITSGCATTFVRSNSTVDPQHVFPATTFDARFFWESGVKGEPLFASADPKVRNGPVTRLAYVTGAIVDLPISIALDTILLPVDLFWPGNTAPNSSVSEPVNGDLNWIVGTWESSSLTYGDFLEWRGASKIQIHAIATNDMDLVLVYPTGGRRIAHDSWPSLMTEDSMYFGPPGSALRFHYHRERDLLRLRLEASNTRIVAKLKRIGPPPSETERLPGMYWRHRNLAD
jgi:uncharacterized protein YceK